MATSIAETAAAAEGELLDDDWLEAEMARELVALSDSEEPDEDGEDGAVEPAAESEDEDALLNTLAAYMQRCDAKYTQMGLSIEENLVSVRELAENVAERPPLEPEPEPDPAPEPEPEPEPESAPESELEPAEADTHAAYQRHIRRSNAGDKAQQVARMRQAFADAEGKLVEFSEEKLAVGAELGTPASSGGAGTQGSAPETTGVQSLADMVDESTREAELWADEEAARVDQELAMEACESTAALAEDAGSINPVVTQDLKPATDPAATAAAAAVAAAKEEAAARAETERKMQEAAARRAEEEAARARFAKAEQRAREQLQQLEEARQARLQREQEEELLRAQQQQELSEQRAKQLEARNKELRLLMEEQLQAQQQRQQLQAESDAAAAKRRDEVETDRVGAIVSSQAMQSESQLRSKEAAATLDQEMCDRNIEIEQDVQQRMNVLAVVDAEAAVLAERLERDKQASMEAATQREKREQERAAEQLRRKNQREEQRRREEAEWTKSLELMREFEEACESRSVERLTLILERMEGTSRLADDFARGLVLLEQWRSDRAAQLRDQLRRAASSLDRDSLEAAIDSAVGCAEVVEDVESANLALEACDCIGRRARDELQQLVTRLALRPSVPQLLSQCNSYLDGWASESRLQASVEAARAAWDGAALQGILEEVCAHGRSLAKVADACRACIDEVELDSLACERLAAASDVASNTEALRLATAPCHSQVPSPQLLQLVSTAREDLEYMQKQDQLCGQLSAARKARDSATLKSLLRKAATLASNAALASKFASHVDTIAAHVDAASSDLQCWEVRDHLSQRIARAVGMRSAVDLRSAVADATESGGLEDVVASTQATLGTWEKQDAMCDRLARARCDEDRPALESAMSEARDDLSMQCAQIDAELAKSQEALASWDECTQAGNELQQAMRGTCRTALHAALQLARQHSKLTSKVIDAEAALQKLDWLDILRRCAVDAIERRALHELRVLFEEAKTSQFDDIVAHVSPHLADMQQEHEMRKSLLRAMAECDPDALRCAVEATRANPSLFDRLKHIVEQVTPCTDIIARSAEKHGLTTSATQTLTALAAHIRYHEGAWDLFGGLSSDSMPEAPVRCGVHQSGESLNFELDPQEGLDMGLEDLESIPEFEDGGRLLVLNLKVNKIREATGLAHCCELREVFLNDNILTSLGEITALGKLRTLSVEINRLEYLEGIGECRHLRHLSASNNRIDSIVALADCAELERVELYRNQISSLAGLEGLRWLQHLDLRRNALTSVDCLGSCPVLQCLQLQSNQIEDLTPGAIQAPLLRELWLSGNPLKSLAFLNGLPALEQLHVSDAEVTELHSLAPCSLLRTVDLSFNKILKLEDLAGLSACGLLEVLRLNDNPVSELRGYHPIILSAMPSLRDLDNEPVPQFYDRVSETQAAFSGLLALVRPEGISSYNTSYLWWLNDAGAIDWPQLLRARISSRQPIPLPFAFSRQTRPAEETWAYRTSQLLCFKQRLASSALTRQNQRKARSRKSLSASSASHRNRISGEEADGYDSRKQLRDQYIERQRYTPQEHQHVLVRNTSYTARIAAWRERSASVTIQSRWRGWWLRHQERVRRAAAAQIIQSRWAAFWQGKCDAAGGKEAVRIQALFRGHHVRRRLQHALDSAKYIDNDDEFMAVDEDFVPPNDLDQEWVPDLNANGEIIAGVVAEPLPQPRRVTSALAPSAEANSGALFRTSATSRKDGGLPPIAAARAFDGADGWSEPGTSDAGAGETWRDSPSRASDSSHGNRVARMLQRMHVKDTATANEWGLTNPHTIAAMKKKAQKYRRHENKARQKKSTAAQRYKQWMGGGVAGGPTPPSSARSEPRSSSLVRRIGSAPPSPALSAASESTGLQQFQSGAPNLRASRDLASRESSGSDAPAVILHDNFVKRAEPPIPVVPAAAAAVPWGMAAGGSSVIVGKGAGRSKQKRKKVAVPRVAQLSRG